MFEVIHKEMSRLELNTPKGELISEKQSHSSRLVFLFDDFVIKFEHLGQTEKEIFFYENVLEPVDAKFFPKLLATGYHDNRLFLVQERVFPISGKLASRKQFNQFNYLCNKYSLDDLVLRPKHLQELNLFKLEHFNCCLTREGLKIFDIGNYTHEDYLGCDLYCECDDCCQDGSSWD
jgi:hypothetical protein